jgi:hypothetical protein
VPANDEEVAAMTATKPVMIYFFMIRFIGLFATDYSAGEETTGPALADKDFFQKNEGAGRGRVYG